MKKLISLLLGIILCFCCCGCKTQTADLKATDESKNVTSVNYDEKLQKRIEATNKYYKNTVIVDYEDLPTVFNINAPENKEIKSLKGSNTDVFNLDNTREIFPSQDLALAQINSSKLTESECVFVPKYISSVVFAEGKKSDFEVEIKDNTIKYILREAVCRNYGENKIIVFEAYMGITCNLNPASVDELSRFNDELVKAKNNENGAFYYKTKNGIEMVVEQGVTPCFDMALYEGYNKVSSGDLTLTATFMVNGFEFQLYCICPIVPLEIDKEEIPILDAIEMIRVNL